MKQRFNFLDLKAAVSEINPLIQGSRLQNVYEIRSRQLVFKTQNVSIAVDIGQSIYVTQYSRQVSATSSSAAYNLVVKLKKHLKNKRIDNIKCLSMDRTVVWTFGFPNSPETCYYLSFEFFSGGNIILIDGEYKVMLAFRKPKNAQYHENYTPGAYFNPFDPPGDKTRHDIDLQLQRKTFESLINGDDNMNKSLKTALSPIATFYGNSIVPVIIDSACLDSNQIISDLEKSQIEALYNSIDKWLDYLNNTLEKGKAQGYIVAEKNLKSPDQSHLFVDYLPFKPPTNSSVNSDHLVVTEYDSFNKAVDEFYSKADIHKQEKQLIAQEEQIVKKMEHASRTHETKIAQLQAGQDQNLKKAQAIEANSTLVHETIKVINGMVAEGTAWDDIGKIIEYERKFDNPVAEAIKLPLDIGNKQMTLALNFDGTVYDTLVKLDLTAQANARVYYNKIRELEEKKQKTAAASGKAVNAVKTKLMKELQKVENLKTTKRIVRKRYPFWFEKFYWFVSSDGYLIIGAHDKHQANLLIHKYFYKGDKYVFNDLENATPVIIKNYDEELKQIPDSTFEQAAALSLSTTVAWDRKRNECSWWVEHDALTKYGPSNEPLAHSSMTVSGTRNLIRPIMPVFGMGLLFIKHCEELYQLLEEDEQQDQDEQQEQSEQKEQKEQGDQDEQDEQQESEEPKEQDEQREPSEQQETREQDDESISIESNRINPDTASIMSDELKGNKKSAKQSRGQATKKKRRAKYADQDEQDLKLAAQILGLKVVEDEPKPKLCSSNITTTPTKPHTNHRDKEQKILNNIVAKPAELQTARLFSLILSTFTPIPEELEDFECAIPVFAPYSSLATWTHKFKIQLGQAKKGKASSEMKSAWIKECKNESQRELVRTIQDTQFHLLIPVNKMKIQNCSTYASNSNDKVRKVKKFSNNPKSASYVDPELLD